MDSRRAWYVVQFDVLVTSRYRPWEGIHASQSNLRDALVPILENHQRPDGSVQVPKALQPFVGREVLEPR